MKLLTFIENGEYKLGVKTDLGVLDVSSSARELGMAGKVPTDVHSVIAEGKPAVEALGNLAEKTSSAAHLSPYWLEADSLNYGPCVTNPQKIICIGLNYRRHAEETNATIPDYPILFNKFNNTLTGHGHDVPLPRVSSKVDYEAELAIVIGKQAKYLSENNALDHVFGYCCVNDISARDLQMRSQQWLLGKSCDGFSPLGPYLVTADEVGDPNNLAIQTTVNGEIRQNSNTSDMIFPCKEIVSYVSQHMTLSPGDIILSGTPEGVVLGYPPEKQVYLKDGDMVTISIEKLGSITNRMVKE
ncbi:fumarylacetoacetate hydrolase family protein [Paenibacillus sp. MMO-58]|uniref:fumarylacetoacetate hydrolase family protein n=1 Tax=Paenibacillus sp. MMO-58 TaxID=3081290 RepID=UPI0030161F09